ncbi:hypothetical protein RQ734_02800 [Roseomonas mucosa]|uniref:hypothetical protein n=1 Tax=Roseomonas mucosa TaxID=207340 RepID=UPI00208E0A76|nr:hypothetical protein [Roseomonas mucosa]MDT8274972.1 hypothetical protein [Roseomonas mucosa]USQ70692.1 hypothetical protein NF552_14350 [Roseomonas mucosa]
MGKKSTPSRPAVIVQEGRFVTVTTKAGDVFVIARLETRYRDEDVPAIANFIREVVELGGVADLIGITAREPA